MSESYSTLPPDQLIVACGVLESTLINIITTLESQGIDTTEYRRGLNEAHMAIDDLRN